MMKRSKVECELPEPIIHHILSFLPGTKEVTRLSLISKWWLHACSSYEVVDFCETCSYDRLQDIEKSERFIKFVDKTMTRFQDSGSIIRIHKFRLHIDFEIFSDESYTANNRLAPLLDKWTNIALDKRVQDLDLRIRVRCIDRRLQKDFGHESENCFYNSLKYYWRYHIPKRVLSSDIVESLSLGWQVCLPRSWDEWMTMDDLRLCSLRSLELVRVPDIVDNKAFQRLIRACPAIEHLIFDTDQHMDEIKVFGLHRLKMISIRSFIVDNKKTIKNFKIKIEAPSLETLCLTDLGRGRERKKYFTSSVVVDCFNLKCLKLTRDFNMDDDQLHGFLSKFPLLENLELEDCSLIKQINIANPMLKKIELKFGHLWNNFNRVEISSPNVKHFRCESTSGKRFPTIWRVKNCPRFVDAVFKNTEPIYLYPYWFRKLRASMLEVNSSNNHTSLSFNYNWEKERDEGKELVPTPLPACKIDNLNLTVTAPSSSYPVILSRLLSTFHPATLQASLFDNTGQGRDFLQFLCENLANRGGNDSCCPACSIQPNKCWKHQLKEVKLEGIKGPHERRSLDWGTMLKQLSSLTVDHWICFRLQWAT